LESRNSQVHFRHIVTALPHSKTVDYIHSILQNPIQYNLLSKKPYRWNLLLIFALLSSIWMASYGTVNNRNQDYRTFFKPCMTIRSDSF